MVDILIQLDRVGGILTIENPLYSLIFRSKHFLRLEHAAKLFHVSLDQCTYNLRLPGAPPNCFCLKRTRFVSKFATIASLHRSCPGLSKTHHHEHAIGSRIAVQGGKQCRIRLAKAAGRYPRQLCDALSHIVRAAELERRQLLVGHPCEHRLRSADKNSPRSGALSSVLSAFRGGTQGSRGQDAELSSYLGSSLIFFVFSNCRSSPTLVCSEHRLNS